MLIPVTEEERRIIYNKIGENQVPGIDFCNILEAYQIREYLSLKFPEEATSIGLEDDLALGVIAKHSDVDVHEMETVRAVMSWLLKARLTLPDGKTEAVLITYRRKKTL